MDKLVLKNLMEVKDYPCISILFPTYRTAPENQKNTIRLKNMVKAAVEKLEQTLGKKEAHAYVEKIKKLASEIDISKTLDGIALFVSKDVAQIVDTPFHVRERLIIDKTFATRDIIMAVNRGISYYLIDLSLHKARLLSCFRDQAVEITENGFPMLSEFDMLELNPTDFSREKEKQIKEFFNKVDKAILSHYNQNGEPLRLVLAGVQKNLSLYKDIADNKSILFEHLEGNFENISVHDMGKKAWEVVRNKMREERHDALNVLQTAVSQNKFVSGISELWRVAHEGRIQKLVVEEGYHAPAGVDPNNNLILDTSDLADKDVMPDAVDEIAEVVLEKGGEVVFVDDGTMGNFQKIAAVLRY